MLAKGATCHGVHHDTKDRNSSLQIHGDPNAGAFVDWESTVPTRVAVEGFWGPGWSNHPCPLSQRYVWFRWTSCKSIHISCDLFYVQNVTRYFTACIWVPSFEAHEICNANNWVYQHIEVETRWPKYSRHCQMRFFQWKYLNFSYNSKGPIDNDSWLVQIIVWLQTPEPMVTQFGLN